MFSQYRIKLLILIFKEKSMEGNHLKFCRFTYIKKLGNVHRFRPWISTKLCLLIRLSSVVVLSTINCFWFRLFQCTANKIIIRQRWLTVGRGLQVQACDNLILACSRLMNSEQTILAMQWFFIHNWFLTHVTVEIDVALHCCEWMLLNLTCVFLFQGLGLGTSYWGQF